MYAAIDWYDGSGTWLRSDDIIQSENYTGDWVPFTTQQITPPAGATKAGIRLSGDGTGTWYIDDLTLTTVAAVTTTQIWSYPNVHGDIQATADATGTKQGGTVTYDPYGNPLTSAPDNITGGIDNTWLGQHNRWNEHNTGGRPLTQMGARPYDATLGRFLRIDPVDGGGCNSYEYACADPVGNLDLDGKMPCATEKRIAIVYVTKFGRRVTGLPVPINNLFRWAQTGGRYIWGTTSACVQTRSIHYETAVDRAAREARERRAACRNERLLWDAFTTFLGPVKVGRIAFPVPFGVSSDAFAPSCRSGMDF